MPKKTVVVVGGGGAGAKLARLLSQKLDAANYSVILVSSHPTYLHYPALLRTLVTPEGKLEEKALVSYEKLFVNGNGSFKHATVTAFRADKTGKKGGEVVLDSGETIKYDVLALSPGSTWEGLLAFPADAEQQKAHIQQWRKKFKESKKVVIAGGGAVGIELAGEIKDFYPKTEVTLVHGDKHLLNDAYPDKFRRTLEKQLRSRGVNLILEDYIDSFPAAATRKGAKLDGDVTVSARGPRPNTGFVVRSLGSSVVNHRGQVKIRPTMQLESYPNVFALGDVIDYPEQKQVGKYDGHAKIAAANIITKLKGTEPTKPYKGMFEAIAVTNGRSRGASWFDILWGVSLGKGLTTSLKSKDLFISLTRKNLGLSS